MSTSALLLAAAQMNGHVTSVDISPSNYEPPVHLQTHYTFKQQNSLAFLQGLPHDEMFDLVFIDDLHLKQHVETELSLLEPHLTNQSIVLMHDTLPGYMDSKDGGPYEALASLRKDEWEFATIPVCQGLTLLRKLYSVRRGRHNVAIHLTGAYL